MNDEVKRFFSSINYASDFFNDATIEKVKLCTSTDSFEVVLHSPTIISKNEIDRLFSCAKNGINGQKLCRVCLHYDTITNDDIKKYLDSMIESLCLKRPSFAPLKDYAIEISENNIDITIYSRLVISEVENEFKHIASTLEAYGFPKFNFNIKLDEANLKSLNEVIEEHKDISYEEPKKDDNMIFGNHRNGEVTKLNNIFGEIKNVIIEGYIFKVDPTERKGKKGMVYIVNISMSDKTDSYVGKLVMFDEEVYLKLVKSLKNGAWYRFSGNIENDDYTHALAFNIKSIESIPSKDEKIVDNAPVKRVELHAHTMMSMMDGVIDTTKLVKFASSLGMPAVAITDHNVLQAFPDAFNALAKINKGKEGDDKFKVIYGCEMNVVDTEAGITYKNKEYSLLNQEYVVFDTETTGLNCGLDQMIEIGAVKVKNNEVIDRFDELIACNRPLSETIVELTNITDDMLKGKDTEANVTQRFLTFCGDLPLVAHNASFDISFVESACSEYNLKPFTNTVVDTMGLARTMYPEWRNHKLSTLVKNLEVEWDEDKHHRADYDAEGTARCFYKMVNRLDNEHIETTLDLEKLIDKDNIVKFARPFHMTILALNPTGLRNLFKIVSLANTKYLYKGKEPKVPRSEIIPLREGLLLGTGCINGEVFDKGYNLDDEDLRNMMSFYDYVEVYPANTVSHLIGEQNLFHNIGEYLGYIKRLIKVAKSINKMVVATSDAHNLRPDDLVYRKIIINQKANGKLHPLNRKGLNVPNQYFLTTDEMLESFSFLSNEERQEIVIDNPRLIASKVEELQIIKDKLYTPVLENSAGQTKDMVYKKAHEIYGDPLPEIIETRLKTELDGIIGGGYDVIYLIAEKLVKKSNNDGYFVGSRGSVGSSLVATMMGITEVNGLPPHYICPNCKLSEFEVDGKNLADEYPCGFDMPDRVCPNCGTKMGKNGHNIPFATFLGFKAEKVPDIDLNFSGENQADAHNYVKVLFGSDHAYRAGTISTVADKTAYGYVKGYCEENGIIINSAETERLALGCTGVKRTTGQHPGGIIVIPQYMDVFDFTAYQYPADEPDATWYTSHFDFHAIHDNVLKLDILGHDDPTMLKRLGDTTHVDIMTIPFDDRKVLSMFNSPDALGVTKDQIMCQTGTLGIPEFGTNFAINMLLEIKPTHFADLVKIAGLSHGTDVWNGNVRDLIVNKVVPFEEAVGCRDDIMQSLINYGLDSSGAFKISEFVRKGKAKKEPEKWVEHVAHMRENDVPEWFIECCHKIQYMFPKAHACAYVMMSFRVAWFKLYWPLYYYSAYFSIRRSDFDVPAMLGGYDGIKRRIVEIKEKGFNATVKESDVCDTLQVALEMLARGYVFKNIDITKSKAKTFVIDEENKALYIPFCAVEGLGENCGLQIEQERKIKPFFCVEDFATRGKVNKTTLEKLRDLGVLDGMPESAQMSLF
jgi:DNA polymerase-3 subunit alpha (Gram-positive type)